MRPKVTSALVVAALLAALALPACGADTTSGAGGGGGDGKYHPAGNGQRWSQSVACDALLTAQGALAQSLSCAVTLRPCPTLLQVMAGGADCLEYDQGSVQGCVEYYASQGSCDSLMRSFDDCVVTSFEGSAPNGC